MAFRDFLRRLGLVSSPRGRGAGAGAGGGGGGGRGVRHQRLPERKRDVVTQRLGGSPQPNYAPAPAGGGGYAPPPPAYPRPGGGGGGADPTLVGARPEPVVAPPEPRYVPPSPAPTWGRGDPAAQHRGGGMTDAEKTVYAAVSHKPRGRVVGLLVAVEGELEGEVFRVVDGENRLGRSRECEIHLNSSYVSRRHARIIHHDGQFVVGPLNEQNPVLVNDNRTDGTELSDGDYLKLGKTTLRFRTV